MIRRIAFAAALALTLGGCASTRSERDIVACVREAACPTDPAHESFARVGRALGAARLVGLGEATHGQHEAFELKRALTMYLIREHGFRVIAYEAAASRALACDDYISGRSDDLNAAMRGFGMLVWSVEENAALLSDLRRWNANAAPGDRVRFVGVDVQDPAAACKRLVALLGPEHEDLKRRVAEVSGAIDPAVRTLWSGEPSGFNTLAESAARVLEDVNQLDPGRAPPEAARRATELRRGIEMHRSLGGRDRAMAEMMLDELRFAGPASRAVLWAHNAHVMRGDLRYLNSPELAMGGHLGAALGEGYYAMGFVFAGGSFNALAQDADGPWDFKAYSIKERPLAEPPRSLADVFIAAVPDARDALLDLRPLPRRGEAAAWLDSEHAIVWFGGYRVPDDLDAMEIDGNPALACVPRRDYDGLAFIRATTPSRPFRATPR